ncbi:hypothetical protein HanPSC8_Chr10g0449691 [Helianthus annuus]|nr:hypothetical protein HanPSC8_Chr10g0449691 [Helianthus annuus]
MSATPSHLIHPLHCPPSQTKSPDLTPQKKILIRNLGIKQPGSYFEATNHLEERRIQSSDPQENQN